MIQILPVLAPPPRQFDRVLSIYCGGGSSAVHWGAWVNETKNICDYGPYILLW